jgi:hypothetical protein
MLRRWAFLVPLLLLAAAPADGPTLEEVEAETDRLDPGWRLADVLKSRAEIPPEENGALRVMEVYRGLGDAWNPAGLPSDEKDPRAKGGLSTLPGLWAAIRTDLGEPRLRFRPEVSRALRARQDEMRPVIEKARALEGVRSGRYPIVYGTILDTPLPDLQNSRAVVQLLEFDALARADRGDLDGALASCRAILGVARTVGDEPFAISQFVRMADEAMAVETILRVLARGEASDMALAATQSALADEARQRLLLIGARGERAGLHDLYGKLASGEISIEEFAKRKADPAAADRVKAAARDSQPIVLRLMNRIVAICEAPIPEHPPLWNRFHKDVKTAHDEAKAKGSPTLLAYQLLPVMEQNSESYGRTRGILRAAELAVGLERVRLATGRWPKPGESLAPAFRPGPPPDPYTDGQPLRWKETDTGLVVYSVAGDGEDGGGNLDTFHPLKPGIDIGYRLWRPSLRNEARAVP